MKPARVPTVSAERLIAAGHRPDPYRLPDGTVLDGYFDPFRITCDPDLLRQAACALTALLPHDTDVLAAPVLAAVPLATAVSLRTGLPLAYLRAAPKTHGTDRRIEGADVARRRAVIVDDTARTGANLVAAAELLRAHGAVVDTALCFLDRELGAVARLGHHGIQLRAVLAQAHPGTP